MAIDEVVPRFSLKLDEQLCFSLYSASRLITAAYRPLLNEIGLTYPQYVTMLVLWERAPVSMRGLGEELGLDYGTLTPLVKRLESAGLVRRRRRVDDERAVDVELTEDGRALRDRAIGIPDRIAELMGLSDRQFATLQKGLQALADNVEASLSP
ncbi:MULTISPECIES: MarR family winged helix-turn-helix transcriptional regulator [Nocardioides]|uniref:MarR family winged helix-turn-helix transcriptional regulator n=1 Tax=Nocardioides vastitatis TaxID=2568655 RepID=A0ABW0ZM47_9ACTN|nr:MarR family winged helix-turn-helix transcriptional regulator [Nocardioides sp.]THJ09204.1 winged helix-turn-helix transcriptional regulator [Nocardioides sp.]